jgi:hypothetical protein
VVFHLGAGVPKDLEVALHPLIVEAHFFSPGSDRFGALGKQWRKPMQCSAVEQPVSAIDLHSAGKRQRWRGYRCSRILRCTLPSLAIVALSTALFSEFAECLLVGCAPVRW